MCVCLPFRISCRPWLGIGGRGSAGRERVGDGEVEAALGEDVPPAFLPRSLIFTGSMVVIAVQAQSYRHGPISKENHDEQRSRRANGCGSCGTWVRY